jgi:hypothetical protein
MGSRQDWAGAGMEAGGISFDSLVQRGGCDLGVAGQLGELAYTKQSAEALLMVEREKLEQR